MERLERSLNCLHTIRETDFEVFYNGDTKQLEVSIMRTDKTLQDGKMQRIWSLKPKSSEGHMTFDETKLSIVGTYRLKIRTDTLSRLLSSRSLAARRTPSADECYTKGRLRPAPS